MSNNQEWSRETYLTNAEGKRIIFEIKKLRKQNKIMREALEFYADRENHEQYGSTNYINEMDLDLGLKARQALKECDE